MSFKFSEVCLFLLWSKCFREFSSVLVFPKNLTFCSILWSLLVRVLNASMFWIIFSPPCRIDLWSCLMCWLNAEASLVSVNLLVLCDCGMGNAWMSYIWSCHWNIFEEGFKHLFFDTCLELVATLDAESRVCVILIIIKSVKSSMLQDCSVRALLLTCRVCQCFHDKEVLL